MIGRRSSTHVGVGPESERRGGRADSQVGRTSHMPVATCAYKAQETSPADRDAMYRIRVYNFMDSLFVDANPLPYRFERALPHGRFHRQSVASAELSRFVSLLHACKFGPAAALGL